MLDIPTQYCEFLVGSVLSQPINAISNIAFLIAAFIAYRYLQKRKLTKLYILPILLVAIGLGSAWWHITNSPLGDILDTFSVILFASVVAILLLNRITGSKVHTGLYFVVLLLTSLLAEKMEVLNGSLPYLALLIGFVLAGTIYTRKFPQARTIFLPAITIFLVAILVRSADMVLCPFVPFGTHFLWHILVAVFGYQLIVMLVHSDPSTSNQVAQNR